MNKQDKGNGRRGIEWCSHTWNPIAGCFHACQWKMDGKIANCYAEDAAEHSQAKSHYPQGFEHHYWHPERLDEPLKVKKPSRIFVGSMADVFGHWVPAEQIEQVLDVCRLAHWHQFHFLTKNPVRLREFEFPPNCWIGASSPPDFMWNQPLTLEQQEAWLRRTLKALADVDVPVRWMSIEPLSFDIAPYMNDCELQWVVIGAASNGGTYYQPDPDQLRRLLAYLDDNHIPVFFKGNLRPSILDGQWREEFPERALQQKLPTHRRSFLAAPAHGRHGRNRV